MNPPRDCGKEAFRTWTDAVRVAKRMQTVQRLQGRDIRGQEPYRCGDHYHLTSHSYTTKKRAS